jgi:hypothetical protein
MVRDTSRLTRHVQELERESTSHDVLQAAADRDQVAVRFEALSAGLVVGEAGGRDWLERLKSAAARHGFEVSFEVGPGERLGLEGLVVDAVPVEVEFRLAKDPEDHRRPVVELVALVHELESSGDALRLTGLLLQGSGQGLELVRLTVRLWTVPPES